MNTYEFNGNKYVLREFNLGLLSAASPLLTKYRKELFKLTADIDTSKSDELNYEIKQLSMAAEEESTLPEPDNELIEKLKQKTEKLSKELEAPAIKAVIALIAEMESLALVNTITDSELMAGTLNGILKPFEGTKSRLTSNELDKPEAIGFIKIIMADFFLLMRSFRTG